MKKIRSILLALLLIFAVCLSACGKEETRKRPERPKRTEEVTEEITETENLWPELSPEELLNEELAGEWIHSDGEAELSFDGESSFWYEEPEYSMEGHYQFDGVALYLKDREDSVYTGCMDRDGNLSLDGTEGNFTPVSHEPELDQSLVGTWTYNFADIVYTFGQEGEFSCESPWESYEGTYDFDGTYLTVYQDDSVCETGWLEDDHRLYLDSLENGWFYTDGGITYEPLAPQDAMKLEPNCSTPEQRNSFGNAVEFHNENQGIYERITADWTLMQGDPAEVGDVKKEIAFVAACYVPNASLPDIDGPVEYGGTYYVYDKYTGLIVSPFDFFLNEDGIYQYEFDSRDGRVVLTYDMDKEKAGPTGDCFDVLAFIATAHMPEWYDGLAFAAMPQPDTYDEYVMTIQVPERPLGRLVLGDNDAIESALRFGIG